MTPQLQVQSSNDEMEAMKQQFLLMQLENERLKQQNLKLMQKQISKAEKMEKILFFTRNLKFKTLEDFKIKKLLGQGSNGFVFLCEVELNNERHEVAVKMILNYGEKTTNSLRGEYENEFVILYKIRDIHENIQHVLFDFVAQPTPHMLSFAHESVQDLLYKENRITRVKTAKTTQFFVTEYHPCTLAEKLDQLGPSISYSTILKYSLEVVDCFLFLFNKQVVHRDVKLDNIFVSEDDCVILGDFGESIETDADHCCLRKDLRAGNMMYTAPEVLNQIFTGGNVDFTKQYSWDAGCLMFEMAFGEFPFEGYPMGFGRAPNVQVPEVVTPEMQKIPREFSELIIKLLANDPRMRMSIGEALDQLKRLVEPETGVTSSSRGRGGVSVPRGLRGGSRRGTPQGNAPR